MPAELAPGIELSMSTASISSPSLPKSALACSWASAVSSRRRCDARKEWRRWRPPNKTIKATRMAPTITRMRRELPCELAVVPAAPAPAPVAVPGCPPLLGRTQRRVAGGGIGPSKALDRQPQVVVERALTLVKAVDHVVELILGHIA